MGLINEIIANRAHEKLLKEQQSFEAQKAKAYSQYTPEAERAAEIDKLAKMVAPQSPQENMQSGGMLGWLHHTLLGHVLHLNRQQQQGQGQAMGLPPSPSQQQQQVANLNTAAQAANPNMPFPVPLTSQVGSPLSAPMAGAGAGAGAAPDQSQQPQPGPQDISQQPVPPKPYFITNLGPPSSFNPAPGPSTGDVSRGLSGASQDLTGATGSEKAPLNAAAGAGAASPKAQMSAASPLPPPPAAAAAAAEATPAATPDMTPGQDLSALASSAPAPVDPYGKFYGKTLLDPKQAIILGDKGTSSINSPQEIAQVAGLGPAVAARMLGESNIQLSDEQVRANMARIQANPDLKRVWDQLDDMQKWEALHGQQLTRSMMPRSTFGPMREIQKDEDPKIFGNDVVTGQPFKVGDTLKPYYLGGQYMGYTRNDQRPVAGPPVWNPVTKRFEVPTYGAFNAEPQASRELPGTPIGALSTSTSSSSDTEQIVPNPVTGELVKIPKHESSNHVTSKLGIPATGGIGSGQTPQINLAGPNGLRSGASAAPGAGSGTTAPNPRADGNTLPNSRVPPRVNGAAGASGGAQQPPPARGTGIYKTPPQAVTKPYEQGLYADHLADDIQSMLQQIPKEDREAGVLDQMIQSFKARLGNRAYINGISPDEFQSTLLSKVNRLEGIGTSAQMTGVTRAMQYADIIKKHLPIGGIDGYPILINKLAQMREGLNTQMSIAEQGAPALKQIYNNRKVKGLDELPPPDHKGKIFVKDKQGNGGWLSPKFFDPNKYSKATPPEQGAAQK